MVLRYMVSDTGLAKGELGQPEKEVEQPERKALQPVPVREVVQPKGSIPSSKKGVKFCFFLMASVVLCLVVYYFWTADGKSPTLEFSTTNKVVVTGIMYHAENPSAVVSGRVVREGDMIDGYKVVRIHRDKVQFEKKGKSFTKQVQR